MILMIFFIIIDCIAKSLSVSPWYAAVPVAVGLLFYVLAVNYECKNILELALLDNPESYTSYSFCALKRFHDQDMVQLFVGARRALQQS